MAAWAAERGLVVSPTAQDLNADALLAAHASGHPDRLAQTWRDTVRRFAAADESIPAELAKLHVEFREIPLSQPRN